MGKSILNWTLFSIALTVAMTVGSFTCKHGGQSNDQDGMLLVVQHPDGCFMLEPKPLTAFSTSGDAVRVKPGTVKFQFDCNGKDITFSHEVREGELSIQLNPQGGG